MNRREFTLLTGSALLLGATPALASGIEYTPGLVDQRLAAGETVFLDFYTGWCSTCAAQRRHIDALRAENPAYDSAMTFIDVDWDVHSRSDLANRLEIPRRSTLVVLRGEAELGRIVAGSSRSAIQALMDLGLS